MALHVHLCTFVELRSIDWGMPMKHTTRIAGLLLLLASTTATAQAHDAGILLTMTVERDGVVLSTPRLVTMTGVKATMQDQHVSLEVMPTVSGDLVELSMQVAVPNDGPRLATPRVLTPLDRKVVIEARSPDSPRYRISVVASSHPIGTTLPPVR